VPRNALYDRVYGTFLDGKSRPVAVWAVISFNQAEVIAHVYKWSQNGFTIDLGC
jgi:hypothetical protein